MRLKFLVASVPVLLLSAYFTSSFPTVYAEEDDETSIIVSDNFDDESAGNWVMFGGGNLDIDTTVAHSGNASIKAVNRKETYQGPSLHCDTLLVAGETYDFDGWVYHEGDVSTTISWTARFIDAEGTTSYAQIKGLEVPPNEWVELTNSMLIPEDAVNYLVYFECTDASAEFFIDDITITGKSNESPQTSVQQTYNYQEQYSYDFETDTEMWGPRGEIKIIHTDEYSNTGSHSIYVTNRTAVWNGPSLAVSDKVRKEESYHYSANVMYNGDEYEDSHIFRLEIQYTIDGVDNYNLIADKKVKKGKWTTLEGYYTVPANAENISIYIQTDNLEEGNEATANDLMSFYADTIKITEGAIVKKEETIKTIVTIAVSLIILVIALFAVLKTAKRIRKNRTALKLVSIDAMTKVFNRNSYEKKIEELENDEEQCKSLYYALCDVNFLKYINDNYGHESGDEAITRCAKMLSEAVGNEGKVYRTGGDEFVCISKVPVSDKIRNAVINEAKNDKGYPFAVACGFAEYNEKVCTDIKSIIAECDKNMYTDKQRIKSENQEFSRK
ncbi:MAG: carbohydrate binding domain-containing protein [Ruminococcus flavefaciens]|nr:carbohydrate binding domain-containing protein [Ruminococcus flavefaciens]MCM1230951.1 carbohydrate binding domain-containing protein [Ruminococcus flavefaciens]